MYSVKAAWSNDPSLGLLGRQKNAGISSVKYAHKLWVFSAFHQRGNPCTQRESEDSLFLLRLFLHSRTYQDPDVHLSFIPNFPCVHERVSVAIIMLLPCPLCHTVLSGSVLVTTSTLLFMVLLAGYDDYHSHDVLS